MLRNLRTHVFIVSLVALLGGSAQAADRLEAPAPGDLIADALIAAPVGSDGPVLSREPVTFGWSLEADAELLDHAEPHQSDSRESWLEHSADALRQGVPILITAPGALVRLNPTPGVGRAGHQIIDPAELVLVGPDGTELGSGGAMELLVTADELAAGGGPFAEGTAAFRLREDLGAGRFLLRAPALEGKGSYVVHVFDRGSRQALALSTNEANYLHGQELGVRLALSGGSGLEEARGFVTSPAGRSWPLELRRGEGGVFTATLPLDAFEAPAPGLWEIEVAASGTHRGLAVVRNARTAFQCALPTARLTGALSPIASLDGSLAAGLGVEVASAGRYEVRGVLYGTDRDGARRPAGITHSAAWLEAGQRTLTLGFDESLLGGSELSAPYEVRDLRLADQGRMGLLHRQALGFVFD